MRSHRAQREHSSVMANKDSRKNTTISRRARK